MKNIKKIFYLVIALTFSCVAFNNTNAQQTIHHYTYSPKNIKQDLFKNIKKEIDLTKFKWEQENQDTIETHIKSVKKQFSLINDLFPSRNQQIIHTVVGGQGLLQTYLLIQVLLKFGYKDIVINVVASQVTGKKFVIFKDRLLASITRDQRILVRHYRSENEFAKAIKNRHAKRSNSYTFVNANNKRIRYTIEQFKKNPELQHHINKIILKVDQDKNQDEIVVTIPFTGLPYWQSKKNNKITQDIDKTLRKLILAEKPKLQEKKIIRIKQKLLSLFGITPQKPNYSLIVVDAIESIARRHNDIKETIFINDMITRLLRATAQTNVVSFEL